MKAWLRVAIAGAGLVAALAVAAPALPSLWPAPVARLDAGVLKRPYVLIARSHAGLRFDGIDVVLLDPSNLRPVSRSPTRLDCLRVHVSAHGEVLCFTNAVPGRPGQFTNPTSYFYAADLSLAGQQAHPSTGRPSRARMSSDGRFGATTEFIAGHSYLGVGGAAFSTETVLMRKDGSRAPENLQQWPVFHEERQVSSPDLNLWGVTFDPSDSNRFFVTAYFAGKPYLAQGKVDQRRITVVKAGVECPSLSPNGKRVAFKKRTGAAGWSPAVLELATMKETVYDPGQSVDDQIEWIDNHTLVYEVVTLPLIGLPSSDLMSLDIAQERPAQQLWLENARSPAFVRAAP